MAKKWKSIITSNQSRCWLCGKSNVPLEKHHVMNGVGYRDKAEEDGLYVMLCGPHTVIIGRNKNGTDKTYDDPGCHRFVTDHPKENQILKGVAMDKWMDYYKKTKEEFIQRYGKQYETNC